MRELVVPSYLPDPARHVLPWTRAKVREVAARNRDVDLGDIWDEAVAALIRAAHHFDPETNRGHIAARFSDYAKLCVVRGLWRYAVPALKAGTGRVRRRRDWLHLDTLARDHDGEEHLYGSLETAMRKWSRRLPSLPSAEEEYAALEQAALRLAREAGGIVAAPCQTTPRGISASPTAVGGARIRLAPKPRTNPARPRRSSPRSAKATTTPTPASRRSTKEAPWPTPMATRR